MKNCLSACLQGNTARYEFTVLQAKTKRVNKMLPLLAAVSN